LQSHIRAIGIHSLLPLRAVGRFGAKLALAALLALVVAVPTPARAADDPAARSLFEAGLKLLDEGKADEACPKFEESLRLQPSVGAQLNLARCHEKQGKLATAWTEYKKAATMAYAAGDSEREKAAEDFGNALAPKLPKLVVTVVKPVTGLVVLKDGAPLGPGAFGVAIAADPGSHRIEASAPGYKSRVIPVDVPADPGEHAVEVPELEIDPSAQQPPPGTPATGPGTGTTPAGQGQGGTSGSVLVPVGIALGVTGVVAAGIGAVLGGLVLSDTSKVDGDATLCPNKQCTVAGQDIIDSARSKATASSVLIPVGGALAVAGVVMLIVGSGSSSEGAPAAAEAPVARVVPLLGAQAGGLMVVGAF
jgi:hypothetical protein